MVNNLQGNDSEFYGDIFILTNEFDEILYITESLDERIEFIEDNPTCLIYELPEDFELSLVELNKYIGKEIEELEEFYGIELNMEKGK